MTRCPACHKGTLHPERGGNIECSECSVLFEIVGNGVRCIPAADPRPTSPILSPELRRTLFFDRLVLNQSPQQIAGTLRDEGIITVSPSTIQNYRDNHFEEIKQAQSGKYPRLRIVTPACRKVG
jgi:hypothetical protein